MTGKPGVPRKHGHAIGGLTPTYQTWQAIKKRCNNPNNVVYRWYGGRGIRMCDRWNTFAMFLQDMGERPSSRHTIDRIDNNGHYEPGNCRWATREDQANNKRNNRVLELNGNRQTLQQWSRTLGIPQGTLHKRLASRGSLEASLTPSGTLVFDGRCQSIHDWAKECGIKPITIYVRLRKGWPLDRVLAPVVKPVDTILEFQGRKQTLTQWAKALGVRPGTIHRRLYKGWPVDKALSTPVRG